MEIRQATVHDVPQMQHLIQTFANEGLMLPRSEKSLYENLHAFTVVSEGNRILGVAGLHILWKDLAEIRSLAVDAASHGRGIGRMIVEHLAAEAEQLGIPQVLSLTYQTTFFKKLNFQIVEKETLPRKVWKDCIYCKKFHNCDEIAMVYYTACYEQFKETKLAENA
ncbi:N-acetyltransferase [Alicyclobacillus tolerans]|uniref:Amino-acid N-acetyltransferase n=2 Tax=Alicyclobacillus tolerans TaxID=90970 RepID=A0A1M6NGE7_9BACL|nr:MULTISPECIES: N-acetyltransferase [Alicyclobacillus]MDP9728316.1 amino-acid N-acetyltransferase [Alicyclobacillus tengchongensis]QRF23888.1 N-acetyltransferase [Alicyclobacillus sp. TC]SHJ94805.1 amino-acid N-acetyltransferase [Alicyclobacillus montanus]